MVHNELKVRIWTSILDLEAFTVAELASHASVEPKQVYGELASLKKQGIVSAETIQSTVRHRPLNLYRVTTDLDVRNHFMDTHLAPRIGGVETFASRDAEALGDPEARAAHSRLDEADAELSELEDNAGYSSRRPPVDSERQISKIQRRLEEARSLLESAVYKLGLPDDDTQHPDHIVVKDAKRLLQYETRASSVRNGVRQKLLTFEAQESFTLDILPAALNSPRNDNSALIRRARTIWRKSANGILRQMLSTFLTELEVLSTWGLSERAEEYPKLLAAKAVRWCADPSLLSACLERVTTNPETIEYNRINALFLQGNHQVAFDCWRNWSHEHIANHCLTFTGARYLQYPGVVIATFENSAKADEWSKEIEKLVGPSASISTASYEKVSFPTLDLVPAVPTLYDPKSHRSEIRLAESLTEGVRPLFASGQLSQRLGLAGVPEVRLATVLLSIGVREKDAWSAAECLKEKRVLVVVCSADSDHLVPAFQASHRPDSIMHHAKFYGERFMTQVDPMSPAHR